MGFYLSFAFKNLRRHLRRTLITAAAIAIGIGSYLFVDSMLQGADRASERNLVQFETGAFRVYSPEGAQHWERLSLQHPLSQTKDILSTLWKSGVNATPRISFQAQLVATDSQKDRTVSKIVRAVGIDPVNDGKVFPQADLGIQGRWFKADENAVVLGKWLAEDLGIKQGDTISLSARTREGSYQVWDADVVGLVDSPNPNVNRATVYLPFVQADTQLGMQGEGTEVVAGVEFGSNVKKIAQDAATLLKSGGFQNVVLTWQDLAPDFTGISAQKQKNSSLILFLVFVIAAVGISNTLLMAFYERKTEIATLRALGMGDTALFWSFLLEAAGIGLIGSLMGVILGAAAVAWLVGVGMDFSSLTRTADIGYRIAGVFRGVWVPQSFVMALILGVLLSAATAILPTRRALKLSITEGLKVE